MATKLKYGTASKIARRVRMTPHHVIEVLKGRRPANPRLAKAIEAERQKQRAAA